MSSVHMAKVDQATSNAACGAYVREVEITNLPWDVTCRSCKRTHRFVGMAEFRYRTPGPGVTQPDSRPPGPGQLEGQ